MRRRRTTWSKEHLAELVERYRGGESAQSLSEYFVVSPEAVKTALYRQGVRLRVRAAGEVRAKIRKNHVSVDLKNISSRVPAELLKWIDACAKECNVTRAAFASRILTEIYLSSRDGFDLREYIVRTHLRIRLLVHELEKREVELPAEFVPQRWQLWEFHVLQMMVPKVVWTWVDESSNKDGCNVSEWIRMLWIYLMREEREAKGLSRLLGDQMEDRESGAKLDGKLRVRLKQMLDYDGRNKSLWSVRMMVRGFEPLHFDMFELSELAKRPRLSLSSS